MESRDIASEVFDLVAEERGVARDRVKLSSRLLHDLGMDGDDAVDFFETVHERFGTDLTHLHASWKEHFGPEGFSPWNGLIIIPAAVIGGLIAGRADLTAPWGFAIAIALLVLWGGIMQRRGPPDKLVAVTVADVVHAVEAGAWPSRVGR